MHTLSRKPQRTCLGCRQAIDRDRLIRFVLSPEGEVLVDYQGKLPGRGAYTHLDRDCLLRAVRQKQFVRAFRGAATNPEGGRLMGQVVKAISGRIYALLGMARKSGQEISGSSMVLDALAARKPALILLAEDVSPGIGAKVESAAGRHEIPVFQIFSKGDIGQVLGKGERSVVALLPGALAKSIQEEILRYTYIAGES